MSRPLCVFATLMGLTFANFASAQAPLSVTDHIPSDARGFAVLRNLATTVEKLDALAKRFAAPAPPLDTMLTNFDKGLDKKRDVGVAWLAKRDGDDEIKAYTHFVAYFPVTDYETFVGQFNPVDTDARITAAAFNGQEFVFAKKGDYAIVADVEEQASLEHVLDSKTSIAETSKPFHDWITENDLTVSLTPSGTQLMFSKLREGLAFIKTTLGAGADTNSDMIQAALGIYDAMFDAGEKEFSQLAIGVQINADESIALRKRVLLAEDGWLTTASQDLRRPAAPLTGIPAGPFVIAFEGAMPSEWSKEWMAVSFNMLKAMQSSEDEAITDEQVAQLSETAANAMKGIHSMAFSMGVNEPDEGMYGKTVGIMRVDDAKSFIDNYEKSFALMNKVMKGTSLEDAYQIDRRNIDDQSVLHLVMDMSKFQPGLENNAAETAMPEQFEKMFGKDGKVSIYLAPADDKAVIMAYTSTENLQRAQAAYRGEASLANDTEVQTTTAMLSDSAQWVGYVSIGGALQFSGNMVRAFAPDSEWPFDEMPPTPPLGFTVELTPKHLDAELVLPLKTVDEIKEFMEMQQ